MSNVLDKTKQQQVIALGRLGWSLRRIEAATGVRRETVSGYLKSAGVAVRGRGGRPAQWPPPHPATTEAVSTDSVIPVVVADTPVVPARAPTASVCEPYRALILEAIRRGRNAMAIWQDLVDQHGFAGRYLCAFRSKRPANPVESGHPFRRNPASASGPFRPGRWGVVVRVWDR